MHTCLRSQQSPYPNNFSFVDNESEPDDPEILQDMDAYKRWLNEMDAEQSAPQSSGAKPSENKDSEGTIKALWDVQATGVYLGQLYIYFEHVFWFNQWWKTIYNFLPNYII